MNRGPTHAMTPERRARVVALYEEVGPTVAGERLGMSARSVTDIARRAKARAQTGGDRGSR